MVRHFRDRDDAGEQLAQRLLPLANRQDVIVLGLPRGGMVVAARVAEVLHLPCAAFADCDYPIPALHSKTVVLVDDDTASAEALVAAIRTIRRLDPETVVAAAPRMCAVAACHIAAAADRTITVRLLRPGAETAACFDEFAPISDETGLCQTVAATWDVS